MITDEDRAWVELGWRFNPLEARDAHGQWTRSGAAYTAPDHSRLIGHSRNPRSYPEPGDHPFFKAHPVSAANIVRSYDAATGGEKAQGMRWYADAGTLAKAIGHGDAVKGAGLLASYSPQTAWPVNMFNAAHAMELGRALGPGDGMITRSMQANAQETLDGKSTDENFGTAAPKIRSFAHLIENGGDRPDDTLGQVVLDRHAMSVAMGERLPKAVADKAPIGTERYYQHVADEYRKAALAITARGTPVAPHQVQAVTWLHQQAANAAQDEAGAVGHGGKGAGKGRQVMIERAWQKWDTEAQQEGFPVTEGTTALSNADVSWITELAAWDHEPRDSRGRWTRFGGVGSAADVMTKNREGFSVSVRSGKEPAHGFMVAQTGHTHTYPESILDDHMALTRAIDDMLVQEKSTFRGGDTYLGGWVHDGKLWLEPSDNIASREQAVREGTSRNQIAIWDVDNGEEIQTGGSGGGRIIEHANPQGGGWAYTGGLRGPAGREQAGFRERAGIRDPAGTITAQLIELGRWEGWRTERRDRHGRWTRTPGEALLRQTHEQAAAADQEAAVHKAVSEFVTRASAVVPGLIGGGHEEWNGQVTIYRAEDNPGVLAEMRWNGTMNVQDTLARHMQYGLAHPDQPVTDPAAFSVPLHELIHGVVPAGSAHANKEAYQDYPKAQIEEGFTELGTVHHAPKFFDEMGLGNRPTAILAVKGGHTVDNPAFKHSVSAFIADLQKQWARLSGDQRAPQAQAAQHLGVVIEDLKSDPSLITEDDLKTVLFEIQHLGDPELTQWAQQMKTRVYKLEITPMNKHDTMTEYARRLQDPARVEAGNAWGHYPGQTKDAQDWVQQIAMQEGYGDLTPGTPGHVRVVQLTDEVNREGAAGKIGVMARQMALSTARDPSVRGNLEFMAQLTRSIEESIEQAWAREQTGQAARAAFQAARRTAMAQMREAAA